MEIIGKIIGVSDLNVKVILLENSIKIGDILSCKLSDSIRLLFLLKVS